MSSVFLQAPTLSSGGNYTSQAYEEKKLLRTGKGNLNLLYVVNKSASTVYVWVYDSLTATGTVLAGPFKLATEGYLSLSELTGIPFSTGCYVAASSTLATYTATATADLSITAQWGIRQ